MELKLPRFLRKPKRLRKVYTWDEYTLVQSEISQQLMGGTFEPSVVSVWDSVAVKVGQVSQVSFTINELRSEM